MESFYSHPLSKCILGEWVNRHCRLLMDWTSACYVHIAVTTFKQKANVHSIGMKANACISARGIVGFGVLVRRSSRVNRGGMHCLEFLSGACNRLWNVFCLFLYKKNKSKTDVFLWVLYKESSIGQSNVSWNIGFTVDVTVCGQQPLALCLLQLVHVSKCSFGQAQVSNLFFPTSCKLCPLLFGIKNEHSWSRVK